MIDEDNDINYGENSESEDSDKRVANMSVSKSGRLPALIGATPGLSFTKPESTNE